MKNLLSFNPTITTQTGEKEFYKIAQKLMNNYVISVKEEKYRFAEIEFYWNSDVHIDGCVYKRTYTNPQTGQWFNHFSGVDIALRDDSVNGNGGILIRGIKKLNEKNYKSGPMITAMILFSGLSAFEDEYCPKIIPYKLNNYQIISTVRTGLGKNAKQTNTELLNYRFVIK